MSNFFREVMMQRYGQGSPLAVLRSKTFQSPFCDKYLDLQRHSSKQCHVHVVAIFTPTAFDGKNLHLEGSKTIFNFLLQKI